VNFDSSRSEPILVHGHEAPVAIPEFMLREPCCLQPSGEDGDANDLQIWVDRMATTNTFTGIVRLIVAQRDEAGSST
jgi:hypothetical protein